MASVLVVDDDLEITETLKDLLETFGHAVSIATSGGDAYDLIAAAEFDLLLLDWDLPDITGPQICRSYRDRGGEGGVLMLTGRVSPEDKVQGLKAGADDYLTKPYNVDEMEARINALLRRVERARGDRPAPAPLKLDETLVGKSFGGRYRIKSVLGRGAMGMVFLAEHTLLRRSVALKILSGRYQGTGSRQRFEREAKVMSMLSHPNLVEIFDYGLTGDDIPYIVMEYVEGKTLTSVLTARKRLPLKESLNYFVQIADALEHAHEQSVIHRDLKPSNVIIAQATGEAKILDLGLAKFIRTSTPDNDPDLTFAGEVLGSPLYMSPEQGTNKPLNHKTDIYSLGCIMYETLTGTVPLSGNSFVEIINTRTKQEPPYLASGCRDVIFPKAMDRIIRQSLNRNPNLRQGNMKELKDQLLAVQAVTTDRSLSTRRINGDGIISKLMNFFNKP